MSEKKLSDSFRTWVEIDRAAARHNCKTLRKAVGPRVKLWAVVKSNAYGHGLTLFSKLMARYGADGLCVDSIAEGLRLRNEGIQLPVLVLGPTLPTRLVEAAAEDVTVSISNFDALKAITRAKITPKFHVKIDTGFHRQGFYIEDIPRTLKIIRNSKFVIRNSLEGVFTHFSAAKDLLYPTYTELQFKKFKEALRLFRRAGFKGLITHAAATGGATMNRNYHLDAVRVGMGLYGYHASPELELQLQKKIQLEPVLSWRIVVSEVKSLKKGDYVGYDLTERMSRAGKAAVLPVGYWFGLPRSLSSVGTVLVQGRRAKILGRVSMDLTVVDVTGIRCRPGDIATLIGRGGREEIRAMETALCAGTSHYELLTRLNPLMERVMK